MKKTAAIGLMIISLILVSGASGCQKGTPGTASENCMPGHVSSVCPDGTARCCLNGWICCSENGENSCTPDSFCSEQEVGNPFEGT